MREGIEDSAVCESEGNINSTDNDNSWCDGMSFGRAGMALTQSELCPPWGGGGGGGGNDRRKRMMVA